LDRGDTIVEIKCLVGGCDNLAFKDGICLKHNKDPQIKEFLAERKKIYHELRVKLMAFDTKYPLLREFLERYKWENKKFVEVSKKYENSPRRKRIKSDCGGTGYNPVERFRQERKLLF
jgi:hypothetical protein